jgi:SPP1 family predicted phage head-tail adaptor
MLFRDVVDLVSVAYTINDLGNTTEVETKNTVFADKQSIRQSEFYQAQALGLKPELMFVVRTIDYNNESRLEYNSKKYNVIRAYDKSGELTELVCSGIVGTEVR